ncbi:MAG: hypothetical protein ACI9AX_000711, partial [Polaromonas sp.]
DTAKDIKAQTSEAKADLKLYPSPDFIVTEIKFYPNSVSVHGTM